MDREEMDRIEKAWRERVGQRLKAGLRRKQEEREAQEARARQEEETKKLLEAHERGKERQRKYSRKRWEKIKAARIAAGEQVKPQVRYATPEESRKAQEEWQRRYRKRVKEKRDAECMRYNEEGRLVALRCAECAAEGLQDDGWQLPMMFDRHGVGYMRLCREHAARRRYSEAGAGSRVPREEQESLEAARALRRLEVEEQCREAARREAIRLKRLESEANPEK